MLGLLNSMSPAISQFLESPIRTISTAPIAQKKADLKKVKDFVPMWKLPELSYDLSGGKTKFFHRSRSTIVISRAGKIYLVRGEEAISFPRRIGKLSARAATDDRIIYFGPPGSDLGILDPLAERFSVHALDIPPFHVAADPNTMLLGLRQSANSNGVLLCADTSGDCLWGLTFRGFVDTLMGPAPIQPYHLLLADQGLIYVASWDLILKIDDREKSLSGLSTRNFWQRREYEIPAFGNYMRHSPIDCIAYEKGQRRLFVSDQTGTLSCWDSRNKLLWEVGFGCQGSRFCLVSDQSIWVWANDPSGGFLGYLSQDGDILTSVRFPHGAIGNAAVDAEGNVVVTDHSRTGAWLVDAKGNIAKVFSVS